jgi:hypothetical protein
MKDRTGANICVGELVSIIGHSELSLQCNWIIIDKIDYGVNVDLVLEQATTKEIRFINILDVQRQF